MLNRYIKVALVERTSKGELNIKVIDNFLDELHNIYKTIGCNTIDIIQRKIKGRTLCFVVDDEYLLSDKPKNAPTGIYEDEPMTEQIYGSYIITGVADNEGNLTDLCALDVKAIFGACRVATRQAKNGEEVETFDTIAYTI